MQIPGAYFLCKALWHIQNLPHVVDNIIRLVAQGKFSDKFKGSDIFLLTPFFIPIPFSQCIV